MRNAVSRMSVFPDNRGRDWSKRADEARSNDFSSRFAAFWQRFCIFASDLPAPGMGVSWEDIRRPSGGCQKSRHSLAAQPRPRSAALVRKR
jgi:hypothetical protein